MNDSDCRWLEDGKAHGWVMPSAPWWKRLPVIRHLRAVYHTFQVERHNAMWRSLGAIPQGYDNWVLYGMARGFERAKSK